MYRSSRTSRTTFCALIRAAVVAGVLFSGLTWTSDVLAGCGDYLHFRGSPGMAMNPVARQQRGAHLSFGRNHDSGKAPEGCQGPNCSRQQIPTLPATVRIILSPVQDGFLLPTRFSTDSEPPTVARRIEDESELPRRDALGIFRPPR